MNSKSGLVQFKKDNGNSNFSVHTGGNLFRLHAKL